MSLVFLLNTLLIFSAFVQNVFSSTSANFTFKSKFFAILAAAKKPYPGTTISSPAFYPRIRKDKLIAEEQLEVTLT